MFYGFQQFTVFVLVSSTEQKVFKNALCGKKGRYVWYIALSHQKAVNTKGQDAIKKKL